nr:molybdate ABC transporter substrate-binding protein [Sphingopyxis sp. MWB1]
MRALLLLFGYWVAALTMLPGASAAERGPLVLAASSLQGALDEVADAWAAKGHARPRLSYAASSALARQIIAGAPADLFISADEGWMDAAARAGRLRSGTRTVLLGNQLVLIVPRRRAVRLDPAPGFALAPMLGGGRLALADPGSVPAGRYARVALHRLGVWRSVEKHLAPAENVRAALALVERGAAPAGIVYASDAYASRRVRVAGRFPLSSHPPIRYPAALLKTSRHRDAAAFRAFLRSSPARAIFRRHGFRTS